MSNLAKRLITFCIGLPVMFGLCLFKPFYHITLQLITFAATIISLNEYYNMVSNKIKLLPKWIFLCLGGIIPALNYIFLLTGISHEIILWVLAGILIIIMGIECFTAEEFSQSVERISVISFGIFYIPYLLTFIPRLTVFENETHIIIFFFMLVFMCDSGAWFFGMLFGKNNRGIFKASPNKSIAGFIGGIFTDVALTAIIVLLLPDIFVGDLWRYLIIAAFAALGAIIGDLVESVIKRSCGAKDAGNVIPGRGGLLDCIDSMVITAPIYFALMYFLLA